ncbi:hypothetical protein H0H87_001226 [Tephrocybe sp. NHM501043]|nr:hypothetical protein H0H87_001226 [Tephrocybe sp. NHM501043]
MSPDRQRPSTSHGIPKPYSRPSTPNASPTRRSVDIAQEEASQETLEKSPEKTPQTILDPSKPGFPSYEQYKQIEADYLQTLTPSRREKALISQALFDRIWAVLHSYDHAGESPQFRFWARKQFALGKLKKPAASSKSSETDSEGGTQGQTVLLHEQSLVAVQEQIYDILCYGHGISNHGGRDRTCSSIREHYTYIPKELVTQFVRVCPTCIAKKCGVKDGDGSIAKSLRRYLHNLGAIDSGKDLPPLMSTKPISSKEKENIIISAESNNRLDRIANHSAPAELHVPESLPMSREVSLYQGLPNGWQFRHNDIADAQEEFSASKNVAHIRNPEARSKRPRIPSIAPMMRTLSMPASGNNVTLSPLDTNDFNTEHGSPPKPQSLTLQPILGSPWAPNIDPSLRNTSNTSLETSASSSSSYTKPRPITPASITRAAAPSSIDLQSLSSQKTIEAFLALRSSSDLTPGSDSPSPTAPFPSPASSDSSSLFTLAMVAAQSASPTTSALLTPTDQPDQPEALADTQKNLAQQTGLMMLNITTEAACDYGPSVIVL